MPHKSLAALLAFCALIACSRDTLVPTPRMYGTGTPAIQVSQGTTVLVADGTAQRGVVTGQTFTSVLTNASCATYTWALAAPSGSTTTLSSTTTSAPKASPDRAGTYSLTLQCAGDAGSPTTYLMTLDVRKVAVTTYPGPINIPYSTENEVATPASGVTQFYDETPRRIRYRDQNGDLTSEVKGSDPLTGDLCGTHDDAGVCKIGGVPISLQEAGVGQVLTRTDAGTWAPAPSVLVQTAFERLAVNLRRVQGDYSFEPVVSKVITTGVGFVLVDFQASFDADTLARATFQLQLDGGDVAGIVGTATTGADGDTSHAGFVGRVQVTSGAHTFAALWSVATYGQVSSVVYIDAATNNSESAQLLLQEVTN